jgi:CBS domain-containing membrane protein
VNASMIRECAPVEISEQDVLAAMRSMKGYIDITPADFREVYRAAYALAKDRMMNEVKARDVMSAPVHPVTLEMDLVEAATLLSEKGISGAPVVDRDGRIVGVVSEKDFLAKMGAGRSGSFMAMVAHCLKNKGCVATPLQNRSVETIMTTPAVTATAGTSIAEIAALLMEKKINRLPITDDDRRVIGIVTRTDLVASYCMLG